MARDRWKGEEYIILRETSYRCSAFQLLQAAGIQPNRDLGFCIIRACFNNQRPDLAVAYARQADKRTAMPLRHIVSETRLLCPKTPATWSINITRMHHLDVTLRLVDGHSVPYLCQVAPIVRLAFSGAVLSRLRHEKDSCS